MADAVAYLIFDLETASDGELIARLMYPGETLEPREAVRRYRADLKQQRGNDFVPYTFHVPIVLAAAKVDENFRLLDLVSLDEPQYRPHVITEHFWRGWEQYRRPTLVSFNGRTFDLPVMELAAFRYGVSVPSWFNLEAKSFEQRRNRYNLDAHIDLQELLTNFGSTRFTGGLHLASNLLGKPGKMAVQGHMVQEMYDEGRIEEISDYCRCDVLDTYFVFLRTRVLVGELSLESEQKLLHEAKHWIAERAATQQACALYMEHWADWENPWKQRAAGTSSTASQPEA